MNKPLCNLLFLLSSFCTNYQKTKNHSTNRRQKIKKKNWKLPWITFVWTFLLEKVNLFSNSSKHLRWERERETKRKAVRLITYVVAKLLVPVWWLAASNPCFVQWKKLREITACWICVDKISILLAASASYQTRPRKQAAVWANGNGPRKTVLKHIISSVTRRLYTLSLLNIFAMVIQWWMTCNIKRKSEVVRSTNEVRLIAGFPLLLAFLG